MSSSNSTSQLIEKFKRLLERLGPELAVEAMMSDVPNDPIERHDFDSLMELLKVFKTLISPLQNDSSERIIVFVIHGIRDEGPWMEMVKKVIQSNDITVQPTDFDDVGAVRFMLGFNISEIITQTEKKLRDAIESAKEQYDVVRVMAIGHSFGTYVLLKVLEDNPTLRIEKMIFCGSVAPRKFRYDKLKNKPALLVNDCGARDIWPILAEGFGRLRYGAAGVRGLRISGVEDRYHDFGHSGYLSKGFVEQFWKPLFTEGLVVPSEYTANRRPIPRGVSILQYGYYLVGGIGFTLCLPWILRPILKDRYDRISWIEFFTLFIPGLFIGWVLIDTIRFYFPPIRNRKDWKYSILLLVWIAVIFGISLFNFTRKGTPEKPTTPTVTPSDDTPVDIPPPVAIQSMKVSPFI